MDLRELKDWFDGVSKIAEARANAAENARANAAQNSPRPRKGGSRGR